MKKDRILPCCCIFACVSPEIAILTEAHHANVRFNSCIRRGTNLARWGLECRWLLHFAMLGPYGRGSEEEGQDSAILLHICMHISRNGDFDRGTPCKCPI